jgi:hypothetical protein
VDAPAIFRVAQPDDVALALEAIDGQRHRRGRDAEMRGEICDGGRLELVEMIEDAGLVAAEQALRLRIAYVACVTGEVDARIKRHHRGHRFASSPVIHLFRQNNIIIPKLLQT